MRAVREEPFVPTTREPTVDVVIPVLNEAHVLARSVAKVRDFLSKNLSAKWQIIVVDNGSADGTGEVAARLAAEHQDVVALHLDRRGRGRALRHAWLYSQADIVGYMDVDLSTELAAVPRAVHAITDEGFDIAIGSRLLPTSKTKRSWQREFISRCYNIFVKTVLWTDFSDAQCGFKFLRRDLAGKLLPQVKDESWFLDTELLVLAEKQGYRIRDLDVIWIEDDDSRVKIVSTAWEDIKGVLRLRRQLWRSRSKAASLQGRRVLS